MTILERISGSTRIRVAERKRVISPEQMREKAAGISRPEGFPLERRIGGDQAGSRRGTEIAFVCEIKKASPSKGLIAPIFPYLEIAREYEEAGAAAISVLTEPDYFLGSDEYLREIGKAVSVPLLRKDFIVDPYQIYEAATLGASAVLLICALLDTAALREYIGVCDELGLSALVEAHDEREVSAALRAGARVIGVNNRNLKDFTVDLQNSVRLRRLVPDDVLFVAESGIRNAEDVRVLREAGVDAVLIGETLMRSPNKKEMLRGLREGA